MEPQNVTTLKMAGPEGAGLATAAPLEGRRITRAPLNPACSLCLVAGVGVYALWAGMRLVASVAMTLPRTVGLAVAWSMATALVAIGVRMFHLGQNDN